MPADLRRYAPVSLLLAIPALLPFGSAAEAALLLAALCGVLAASRDPTLRREPAFLLASLLFLGYWLPELASAPDALDSQRAWREVALDLRYLPLPWFAIAALRRPGTVSFAWRGMAVIVAAFAADALLQAVTGHSLAGGADRSDRLSGVFGADDLKLGPVLAVLSPIALLVAWQRAGWRGFLLAFALLVPVVLLAGARAGWVGLALALGAVLWHRLGARRAALAGAACLAGVLLVGAASLLLSERFAERVARTSAAFAGDAAGIDHALAGRLPIWGAALAMGADHPFNGVGVRGFRSAYPDYAAPDDTWVAAGGSALHAHHLLLEVWSETGAIGLVCWLLAAALGWSAWRRASAAAREAAAPAALSLLVMLFPLNTHFAFYSSFWALLLFVLLALFCGALAHGGSAEPAR